MLEMQRLSPEMRKLQKQHRNDRQKLNEEMMKLYQEHKVNPMASCLPLVAQMPVFIIMFRILHGLTYKPVGRHGADRRGDLRRRRPDPARRARASSPATSRTPATSTQSLVRRQADDEVVRPRPGQVARRRRSATDFGTRPDLRPARRGARPAVLRPAADGRRPRGGQPDDVAAQQKLMQYLPVVVRRVPGVLPARPGRLLHRPDDPAHRAAVLHHADASTATTSRSAARPSGPASRHASWPRPTRTATVTPLPVAGRALRARSASRRRGARQRPSRRATKQPSGAGNDRRRTATSKRTTAPKGRPTPTRQGRRAIATGHRRARVGLAPRAPASAGADDSREAAAAGRTPRRTPAPRTE